MSYGPNGKSWLAARNDSSEGSGAEALYRNRIRPLGGRCAVGNVTMDLSPTSKNPLTLALRH